MFVSASLVLPSLFFKLALFALFRFALFLGLEVHGSSVFLKPFSPIVKPSLAVIAPDRTYFLPVGHLAHHHDAGENFTSCFYPSENIASSGTGVFPSHGHRTNTVDDGDKMKICSTSGLMLLLQQGRVSLVPIYMDLPLCLRSAQYIAINSRIRRRICDAQLAHRQLPVLDHIMP